MNRENIKASTCRCRISPSIPSRLLLVFFACTIFSSSAVSSGNSDQPTSDMAGSPKAQLLFFTARWCAPCRKLKPDLLKICEQNKTSIRLIEIDYDAAPLLVKEYGVNSLPTIILLDSSGMPLMRINESSEEALKALTSEIQRLAKIEGTKEKGHVKPTDFPPAH